MNYSIDDILKLSQAGFTAEQITALAGITTPFKSDTAPASSPVQPEPQADSAIDKLTAAVNTLIGQLAPKAEAAAPAEAQPEEPKANPLEASIEKLNEAITKMQNTNIVHTEQPERETTDDILAQIINPPRKK